MNYNLEERTAKFGEEIIKFIKTLPENVINRPLISQIVRSATSIGANYMEANQASSKKDFKNKIRICQKEANETKHWLRMIVTANFDKQDICRKLWKESHELTLIFAKISKSCK
ncbi:MAG: four helix bundle protein [Candidatus Magasanikbacteria bacterium CG10_big_fil_rev_8_21_14_0_10_36_32]|uniref:Four helix bundle protein n=1 Tax=Candidatus Magasanikbacteria bacterium CG10_big_fil_rev_8_21_14_0_10_36_32 TaxID=1974646 RepID=A0A2M6W6D6_9BACT|nr:MAG: four helix bundle protein [Candidatus Magasanikbacteria bacterium CG10_big_fil_rev_8_21_14_0_10_36_32]